LMASSKSQVVFLDSRLPKLEFQTQFDDDVATSAKNDLSIAGLCQTHGIEEKATLSTIILHQETFHFFDWLMRIEKLNIVANFPRLFEKFFRHQLSLFDPNDPRKIELNLVFCQISLPPVQAILHLL
jgi:hypothetical protein